MSEKYYLVSDIVFPCKRCGKNDAVPGKKNCIECASYYKEYKRKKRAEAKQIEVSGGKIDVEVFIKNFVDKVDNKKIEIVDNKKVPVKENNLDPELLRFFYKLITGKSFRKNTDLLILEFQKIFEK